MNDTNGRPAAKIGSVVKVKEHGMDEEELFRIGDVTKPMDNQVAPENPMGQALLGAQPGDEVTVNGPEGPIKFDVLDVRPEQAD
jgi:transcription elongation factor GreA